MFIFLWIIFGALIGWVASLITGDNKHMEIITHIVVGLFGALLGGLLATLLNIATITSFSWLGLGFSVLCSVIILCLFSLFRKYDFH